MALVHFGARPTPHALLISGSKRASATERAVSKKESEPIKFFSFVSKNLLLLGFFVLHFLVHAAALRAFFYVISQDCA